MKKTLGGDRLGSGNRMKVELHGYERSTHDIGYLWRSTMSAGTLVPFMSEVALPGTTFDIDLDIDIKTHPTIGPLFGSYKVQADVFLAPIRLYQGSLHNNRLGIGMNMASIKLPLITLPVPIVVAGEVEDLDNSQINPSCILKYLGLSGIGMTAVPDTNRKFNALPILAYWDIYKNYYANKQEEIGSVIHNTIPALIETIDSITVGAETIEEAPVTTLVALTFGSVITINYTGASPNLMQVLVNIQGLGNIPLQDLLINYNDDTGTTTITGPFNRARWGDITAINWAYMSPADLITGPPGITTFPLENIDIMRDYILIASGSNVAFGIEEANVTPYEYLYSSQNTFPNIMSTQEGLGLKTYQSDLFNNWLQTEWIDGAGGITEITEIDTSGGSFSIDTLNLSRKVYNMLNRIAVSGGSYDDWQDAVYTHERYTRCESPMYMGGLIKELIFQEVISNSESDGEGGAQPLGTLAGRGVMAKKHKGGRITVKVDEPCYVMGIISLTPRIDYSQGNKWDMHLLTMDDFHKPALDEIGFQELITEQMAWWSTTFIGGNWVRRSAGKQPAWINYMTNVNKTYGNFAIATNEMFMTLNRRYEYNEGGLAIADLTTYIDPSKYNFIFANTALDSQNFWTQIAIDITARRKMSAKLMPNL